MTLTTGWSAPAAGEGPDGHGEGGQPPTPLTASASNASNDLHGLTDSAGHRLRFTQTPRLHARHPAAQRWRAAPRRAALSGAPKTPNDRRYAATLATTAEAEFLKTSTPRCSIRHLSPAHRIWPDVPFSENDAAKAAGTRTDPGRRSCSRRGIPGSRQLKRQGTA
jgi:hypothetical protein